MFTQPHVVKDENGNLVRFEQLYDTYFQPIFNYILHRVANVAEAEDITSQTFFKALRNLSRFRWSGGSFQAWLYRIATNEVNSHYRKKKDNRSLDDSTPHPADAVTSDAELMEAEQKLTKNKMFLDLQAAMLKLKPIDQTLITLRYFEHKTFSEIAGIVRKREGAITMRTHRALTKLKSELEKRGIDHERIRGSFEEHQPARYSGGGVQARFAP